MLSFLRTRTSYSFNLPSRPELRLRSPDLEEKDGASVVKSGHTVARTKVLPNTSSDLRGKIVFFKQNTQVLSQCESAFGDCYRLLVGDKVPKVRAVYDDSRSEVVGLCSEAIPGFVDIRKLQSTVEWMRAVNWKNLNPREKEAFGTSTMEFSDASGNVIKVCDLYEVAKKHEALLDLDTGNIRFATPSFKQGFAEILVASYLFEEDDLHKHNFGVDADGTPRRIDLDMSFFGSVYVETRGERSVRYLDSSPSTWNISIQDIVDFPVLKSTHPWFWPTVCKATVLTAASGDKIFTQQDVELFSSFAKDETFVSAKYYSFLKALLIPERYFEESFTKHLFFAENAVLKRNLVLHLRERQAQLLKLLLTIPEFGKCLTEDNVERIIAELQLERPDDVKQEILARFASIKSMVNSRIELIGRVTNDGLREYLLKTAPGFSAPITIEKIAKINELLSSVPTPKIYEVRQEVLRLGYDAPPMEHFLKMVRQPSERTGNSPPLVTSL